MKFSIITVCLNPGRKLNVTLESVLAQTCSDVEVVLKDGGSTDGSVESWLRKAEAIPGAERVRLFVEKDKGIYDAMNQAVSHAKGEFILFLNCGDVFPDNGVLERTLDVIEKEKAAGADMDRLVLYGDTYSEKNGVTIISAPVITGFTCYRNIPCHQSCFYSAHLCKEKPYDLQYKIRADYDHFLWCFYEAGAKMVHMDFPVASYEGGGYSESRENRKRDRQEHRRITAAYMGGAQLFCYRAAMMGTLAPLRRAMAESRLFSGAYHWLKERVYRRRIWCLAAVILFIVEMALLAAPVGWLGEEQVSYLTGEGSWALEASEENHGYTQEFTPKYRNIKSIGIVAAEENMPEEGYAHITVSDADGRLLFEKELSYGQFSTDVYTDIAMNLSLKRGGHYFLSVNLEADKDGKVPMLMVCGTEYDLPENISLTQSTELEDVQLLTRYIYSDAIPAGKLMRAILLCGLTALVAALGFTDNQKVRKAVGIALLILIPYVLGRRLEVLTINTSVMLPFSMRWNVGLMYLMEIIVLLCTQSIRFSVCFSNVLLILLYSANYFVYAFRGEPLRLNDLTAISTAAKVVGNYSLRPNSHLAFAWGLGVLFLVCGIQSGGRRRRSIWMIKKTGVRIACGLASFACGAALAFGSGYMLLYTDLLADRGFTQIYGFDQHMNYYFNGFLVASLMDIQDSRVREPEGYSVEKVEKLLKEAAESASSSAENYLGVNSSSAGINPSKVEMPHIILIMNESFSDLRVLGDLQISEENMSFFNSLEENTIRGYVNASVLGGGTANSEFEVFTGCSMGFLPASYYAYQQCMDRERQSLISLVKDAGYTAYSIHPESSANWNRRRVYGYLGFDYSLWEEDFEDAEIIHYGISDLDTYKMVEELYENREEDERLFIFNLTVQNHGGYTEADVEQTVTALNVASEEADTYLSLIKESDSAFEQLIQYFAGQDEPVLICMYGDHQPKIKDEAFYNKISEQTEGMDEREEHLSLYKTPFIIWANYDIPEQEGMDIGMSYLGALLMDTAGISCSPFFAFLQQYMEEYPIVTINGYVDKEGNKYDWSGEDSELWEYRILQYNYLFE